MSKGVLWAAVTAAFLAGTSLIACAQSGSVPGPANSVAGVGQQGIAPETAGGSSAAGTRPSSSDVQGLAGNTASGGGSLMPCSSTPPYTSLPCLPVKR
jgi:hypothetical protein